MQCLNHLSLTPHVAVVCCFATATERIRLRLQRLQRYTSPDDPPALQPVAPPVPDISPALLADGAATIHLLDADLAVLTNFTR